MQRRFVRLPSAILIGSALTFAMNLLVLRPIFLNDLEELGLAQKYFELDLNADLMREDLKNMGIKIEARHFDMEAAQARADAQSANNED